MTTLERLDGKVYDSALAFTFPLVYAFGFMVLGKLVKRRYQWGPFGLGVGAYQASKNYEVIWKKQANFNENQEKLMEMMMVLTRLQDSKYS